VDRFRPLGAVEGEGDMKDPPSRARRAALKLNHNTLDPMITCVAHNTHAADRRWGLLIGELVRDVMSDHLGMKRGATLNQGRPRALSEDIRAIWHLRDSLEIEV